MALPVFRGERFARGANSPYNPGRRRTEDASVADYLNSVVTGISLGTRIMGVAQDIADQREDSAAGARVSAALNDGTGYVTFEEADPSLDLDIDTTREEPDDELSAADRNQGAVRAQIDAQLDTRVYQASEVSPSASSDFSYRQVSAQELMRKDTELRSLMAGNLAAGEYDKFLKNQKKWGAIRSANPKRFDTIDAGYAGPYKSAQNLARKHSAAWHKQQLKSGYGPRVNMVNNGMIPQLFTRRNWTMDASLVEVQLNSGVARSAISEERLDNHFLGRGGPKYQARAKVAYTASGRNRENAQSLMPKLAKYQQEGKLGEYRFAVDMYSGGTRKYTPSHMQTVADAYVANKQPLDAKQAGFIAIFKMSESKAESPPELSVTLEPGVFDQESPQDREKGSDFYLSRLRPEGTL